MFNRFEIELPEDAVTDCSHRGECYDDVSHWQTKIDLSHIADNELSEELSEYGAWDEEELQNREDNEKRIVWIAAGNIKDSDDWEG